MHRVGSRGRGITTLVMSVLIAGMVACPALSTAWAGMPPGRPPARGVKVARAPKVVPPHRWTTPTGWSRSRAASMPSASPTWVRPPGLSTNRWSLPPRPVTTPATGSPPATAGSSTTGTHRSSGPPAICGSTSRSSGWPRRPTTRATGWSPPTGASSPSATRRSSGPPAICGSTSRSWPWPRRLTARVTGWSPPTGVSSPSAMPGSTARPGTSGCSSRSSGWPPHRTGRATGWSPPTVVCSPSVTPRSTARRPAPPVSRSSGW